MSQAEKRPYTKRNPEYWANRAAKKAPEVHVHNHEAAPAAEAPFQPVSFPDIEYGSVETRQTQGSVIARAGSTSSAPPTNYRGSQANNGMADPYAFQNLRALPVPYIGFTGNRSYASMQEAIQLCVKAWTGIPAVRNAIEVAVEFSAQPLVIKSDNKTVQTFFTEWWQAIQGPKMARQAFRGYYREGNNYYYTFYGRFGPAYFKNLQNSYGAKENRVPIRYELINPATVYVPTGLTFPYSYVRLLSTFEIERLRNPLSEQDKQVYNSLPKDVKQQIQGGAVFPMGLWLPMDLTRLRFFFYKKQDFEPMAVPMVWPVLPDIEWKLTLKKMDMELARKIEHAILIVTTGEAPSKENGGNGINQNNLARLQNLFTNQTISRVLVADYTTKAQWAIPDVKEILGADKYKVVDADIKEGLQSILTGDDKFATAQIKAKIFIQRLEEGQQTFLDDFLMPEIKNICETMGFRTVPSIEFQRIDLQDEAVMARIVAQLAQIGVLTAPEAVKAIATGVLPDQTEMERNQQVYKKDREDGLYQPLIGGQKDDGTGGMTGKPSGTVTTTPTAKKPSPIGTSKAGISVRTYTELLKASSELGVDVEKALMKRFKIKTLNEQQQAAGRSLVEAIMATQSIGKWRKSVAKAIEMPPEISREAATEIDDLRFEYDVDSFDATILRHCRTEAPSVRSND